jgi:hypothetical protein
MEVRGQLYTLSLYLSEWSVAPIEQEDGRAREPSWTFRKRGKPLALAEILAEN